MFKIGVHPWKRTGHLYDLVAITMARKDAMVCILPLFLEPLNLFLPARCLAQVFKVLERCVPQGGGE